MTNKGADNCNCNNNDNNNDNGNKGGSSRSRVGVRLRWKIEVWNVVWVYFICDSLSLSTMPWVVEGSASS
jgi:hypothetical protein